MAQVGPETHAAGFEPSSTFFSWLSSTFFSWLTVAHNDMLRSMLSD